MMIALKKYIFLFFTLFVLATFLFPQTQTEEIQHSKEKVLLAGKIYYIHTVRPGETLYALAKAYNLTIPEVLGVNPTAANELKPGMVLKMPEPSKSVAKTEIKPSNDYLLHVVEPGQTVYSISKRYNLLVSDIEKANPELRYDSIQINQVLKIPLKTSGEGASKDKKSGNYWLHRVEEKETLYSLAKRYNVSQNDILQTNMNLANTGLRFGDTIRIPMTNAVIPSVVTPTVISNQPVNQEKPVIAQSQVNQVPVLTTPTAIQSHQNRLSVHQCDSIALANQDKTVRIALLLPLYANPAQIVDPNNQENDAEDKTLDQQVSEFSAISSNFIEFYEGALVACDVLKKNGVNLDLTVIDTENKTLAIDNFIKSPVF